MIDQDRIAELNEPLLSDHRRDLAELSARIRRGGGADPEAVTSTLAEFSVAAPSWALGTGGTRFGR
ncbi:MAG TPA: sugar isomerase, partial [Actinomycetes bacterium]|nr:sugar isomerase [Actinomycetes bacterium]